MFRTLFKNKETGELSMFWRYFIDRKPHYYKDISLTDEVDISNYEAVNVNNNIPSIPTPYQLFGVECERGWFPLIQPVIDYIDNYNAGKSEDEMIHVMQIKEKYGTLNIYVSSCTPELSKLIEEAEEKSERVCEICGSEKNIGTTLGWYITICHDCIKQRCKDRNESIRWCCYGNDSIYLISPDKEDEFIETITEYESDLP